MPESMIMPNPRVAIVLRHENLTAPITTSYYDPSTGAALTPSEARSRMSVGKLVTTLQDMIAQLEAGTFAPPAEVPGESIASMLTLFRGLLSDLRAWLN